MTRVEKLTDPQNLELAATRKQALAEVGFYSSKVVLLMRYRVNIDTRPRGAVNLEISLCRAKLAVMEGWGRRLVETDYDDLVTPTSKQTIALYNIDAARRRPLNKFLPSYRWKMLGRYQSTESLSLFYPFVSSKSRLANQLHQPMLISSCDVCAPVSLSLMTVWASHRVSSILAINAIKTQEY